jgi:pimeloyl-ACP methyl ester carboxylesterase
MAKHPDWKSLALKSAGLIAGAGVTGVSAWLLYSRFFVDHARPLPKAIDARRREDEVGDFGLISHYEDTAASGTPLVLLHSINAAASAYEMKPLFEQYRRERPVFAVDLPGFGFSARVDRTYSPKMYAETIAAWIEKQVRPGEPVDAVALSVSSEFVARAALDRPELFRSLALISPTGFDHDHAAGNVRTAERVRKSLAVPLWSQAFYDALVTMPSIRHYLRKAFRGAPNDALAAYAYATAHQPGARYAPLHFIAGKLFSQDILDNVYSRLQLPVLVIYDHDEYVSFDLLPDFVERHGNWRAVRIRDTGSMPHFEKTDQTARELNSFWSTLPRLAMTGHRIPSQLQG